MTLEVYQIFKKNTLDIEKLVKACKRKNQNIYQAIGAILSMADLNQMIIQCECGEILSYPVQIFQRMSKLYTDNKVKCKFCDPDYKKKIEQITAEKVISTSFKASDLDFKDFFFFD